MLCATVENGVDSCNGKTKDAFGVWKFSTFPSTYSLLNNQLYRSPLFVFAGDSGREAITLVHVMKFFLPFRSSVLCKKKIIAADEEEGRRNSRREIPKFSQLLNKNLFTATYNTKNEKFPSWLTFTFLTLTVRPRYPSLYLPISLVSGGAVLKGCLQVGIISFGSSNCGSSIPSVFTRIEDPAIREFIRSTTGV